MTRLRDIRRRRFLTQAELSENSGLTIATISQLEHGRRRPSLWTVRRLAEGLGVRPEKLIDDKFGWDDDQARSRLCESQHGRPR